MRLPTYFSEAPLPPAPLHSISCMVMGIRLISKPMIALARAVVSTSYFAFDAAASHIQSSRVPPQFLQGVLESQCFRLWLKI